MENESIKFSVIVPNYKDVRIKRCIESLVRQTYNNYELIVVDGKSESKEIYDIYKDSRIDKLIIEPDNGIFDAINKGILISEGDIILLLGSDDYLLENHVLESVSRQFRIRPNLDIVGVQCIFVNHRGKVIREWNYNKISRMRILFGDLPPHFSLFIRKRLYDETGLFALQNTNNLAEDSIWLVRMAYGHMNLTTTVIHNCHTVMEIGGTSNKSIKNIILQNYKLYLYLRRSHIKYPAIFIIRKLLSKLFQLRLNTRSSDCYTSPFVGHDIAPRSIND